VSGVGPHQPPPFLSAPRGITPNPNSKRRSLVVAGPHGRGRDAHRRGNAPHPEVCAVCVALLSAAEKHGLSRPHDYCERLVSPIRPGFKTFGVHTALIAWARPEPVHSQCTPPPDDRQVKVNR
jgi:hypothetical protein